MKKILIALTALALSVPGMSQAGTPATRLIKRLAHLQKKGVMIGHQDDPVYGTSWRWDLGRSDVRDVCGDYPAVMGFDLGKIELGSATNLDGVPFGRMRQEIILQHERGGVATLSWHPWNPATGENAWDPSGEPVGKILPGGELNGKLRSWLDKVAAFILSLKTSDGKAVPVIFRPWHEMNGGWFWWGAKSCTADEYKELYAYTHDYLTQAGCSNVVWAYSPNGGSGNDFETLYPGDAYVDLIGFDQYEFDADNAVYTAAMRHELDLLVEVGRRHGKLIAITETGCQNVSDPTWFTSVLLPLLDEYPVSYVLLWRNAWDNPKENYIAAPGRPTERDFKEFARSPRTLFAKDAAKTLR